jgi:hypothetical protein
MLNKGLEFKSGCNTINRGDAGDCEMAIRGGIQTKPRSSPLTVKVQKTAQMAQKQTLDG